MLENFLKNELANKYDVAWMHDYYKNAIIVRMRDGLLEKERILSMDEFIPFSPPNFEFMMVQILRELMREIDDYNSKRGENQ